MPYHRPVILGAGLCLVALAGWGGRAALSRRPGPPAVPALCAALRDPRPEVRREAAAGLWQAGPAAAPAAEDLGALLADADEDAGDNAGDALGGIGPAALPVLGPALRCGGPAAR